MTHIVEYEGWCQKCKFFKQDEDDYPCNECLAEPIKEDGRRPVHYTEDKAVKRDARKR